MSLIDRKFKNKYDFFYLRMDTQNKCNVGYAFINLMNLSDIWKFKMEFHQMKWEKFKSKKVCKIFYAENQGLEANIKFYQNKKIMSHHDDRFKPYFRYKA